MATAVESTLLSWRGPANSRPVCGPGAPIAPSIGLSMQF